MGFLLNPSKKLGFFFSPLQLVGIAIWKPALSTQINLHQYVTSSNYTRWIMISLYIVGTENLNPLHYIIFHDMTSSASLVCPRMLNTVAAMWDGARPAEDNWSLGDPCSIYRSGRTTGLHCTVVVIQIILSLGQKLQRCIHFDGYKEGQNLDTLLFMLLPIKSSVVHFLKLYS